LDASADKGLEAPEIPHFDWSSRPRGRLLIACDDEEAVKCVKHFVSNFADSYGAWRSDEGPNRRPLQVMFLYPTGDCKAEEIVSIAIKDNCLEGDLSSSSYSKKIPKIGHFIRFVVGIQFMDGSVSISALSAD